MPDSAQRASHRALLQRTRPWNRQVLPWNRQARLDAIIVPSAREASAIYHAGALASRFGSTLIVLASRAARGAEIHDTLAPFKLDNLYVVDVPADLADRLPAFQTSKIVAREAMERTTDVSAKRNLGLAVTQMVGLHRVVFLDDDMYVPRPVHLKEAASLLHNHDVVGLSPSGFPDNSVVCHANRQTGGTQDTFIGAGALVLAADRATSFFPNVYNEDWFFLLDDQRLRSVAVTGRAQQREYDPFSHADRARLEEFGDVLAEGVFALLGSGGVLADANSAYWRRFILERHRLIVRLIHRAKNVRRVDRKKARKMDRSLQAAQRQLKERITPRLCVEFLRAWQADLVEWKTFRDDLERGVSVETALDRFDLVCAVAS